MNDELSNLIFTTPAQVMKRAPTGEMMTLAKANHAFDEEIFTENPPFFWRAEISSNRIDSFYTRMGESTLRNFVTDLSEGVSFQDSHDTSRLGLGRSLKGTLEESEGVVRVLGDFFTVRGLKFNGGTYQTSDDFINSVRAGIANDISQGFYFLNTDPAIFTGFRCDICKRDLMRDYDCLHIPGVKYEITDEQGRISQVICTATVENAHASEVSAVFSGSTPGAAILKAVQESESGRMKPETARLLEQRYRSINLKFPDKRASVPVGNSTQEAKIMETPKEPTVQERQDSSLLETQTRQLGEVITEAPKDKPIIEQVRFLNDEVRRLRPLADDGTAYRASLIEEAHAEGVRAHGTEYAKETYQGVFATSTVEVIKRMRDDFARIAKEKFPSGRQSKDEGEDAPVIQTPPQVNPAAFRA